MSLTEIDQINALLEQVTEHLKIGLPQGIVANRFREATIYVGRAWSGSSLGYHSRVYYDNFQTPPPGAHFHPDWGLEQPSFSPGSSGTWTEFSHDTVISYIRDLAGGADLTQALQWADEGDIVLDRCKNVLRSIALTRISRAHDTYLAELIDEVNKLSILTVQTGRDAQIPSGSFTSRDSLAISQGLRLAPHQEIIAQVVRIESAQDTLTKLASIGLYMIGHLRMSDVSNASGSAATGSKIFIGHGRSDEWRKLAMFIGDRMRLTWDEFNQVPAAGIATVNRLSVMLDDAVIGLIVMTGEDEVGDGMTRARENVIHEAGLFQGRLGFDRAIVLLEEGCNEFSNINGLGQIRFPKGNIGAVFEEVRRVLEREGLGYQPSRGRA